MSGDGPTIRKRLSFMGVVQGVGFRPTVLRFAVSCGLVGFVQNLRSEVVVEVQGTSSQIDDFSERLLGSLTLPAAVERVAVEELRSVDESSFRILESGASAYLSPPIPPDLALCDECREELLDPANRRYLYPFITCTRCGPRYTIVETSPFDRSRTSMADFPACPACRREYDDPSDRRFHSETNSCPECGPHLSLYDSKGKEIPGDPILETISALGRGQIAAIMGIGGFHLAADPRAAEAVERLRRGKGERSKPFALMVRDPGEAAALCRVGESGEELLRSFRSPIVIFPKRPEVSERLKWIDGVSDTESLGIMLPYTPLHLLLFSHPEVEAGYGCLIMTSGNRRDEPTIIDPDAAREKLACSADLFLVHNRRILSRADDSVVRAPLFSVPDSAPSAAGPAILAGPALILRRGRGYAPATLRLPVSEDVTLAVGSDLKNAPALAVNGVLHLAPHIGDLADPSAREAFEAAIARFVALCGRSPSRVVSDLHPSYWSAGWADRQPTGKRVRVQHHHAHLLSVMAEHELAACTGLAFDGTGYGDDGSIWGGEFLAANRTGYRRLGHFSPFPLPGGEGAIRKPGRLAFALLAGCPGITARALGLADKEGELLAAMMSAKVASPVCTSAGRLFDAAAYLLGLVAEARYEGEGAMKLEGVAIRAFEKNGAFFDRSLLRDLVPMATEGGQGAPAAFTLEARPLLAHLLARRDEVPVESLALLFHAAFADAALRGALRLRELAGDETIALGGGVFQNVLLRTLLVPMLEAEGFSVALNKQLPPGDGGIAVGQAWYAGE